MDQPNLVVSAVEVEWDDRRVVLAVLALNVQHHSSVRAVDKVFTSATANLLYPPLLRKRTVVVVFSDSWSIHHLSDITSQAGGVKVEVVMAREVRIQHLTTLS